MIVMRCADYIWLLLLDLIENYHNDTRAKKYNELYIY